MTIRDRLFSAAFWVVFAVSCTTNLTIQTLLWVVATPFDHSRKLNHLFSCFWGYSYVKCIPGWDAKVLNRERIESKQPYVLVANHTSLADIALCHGLFCQFKWVSKQSNFSLPFIGQSMRLCRYIPLKRGDRVSVEAMLEACRTWLGKGMSIMMFPEGARSIDGKLKPFKPGAFTLSRQMKVPIIPIAIGGGYELVAKHQGYLTRKARLRAYVIEPMLPDTFSSDSEFAQAVRERIGEHLRKMGHTA